MIRSENFSDIIAMMVATDKQGVVSYLRSQGVDVNSSDDVTEVVKVLYIALTSDKLRQNFIKWAETKYQNQSNFMGKFSSANGNFDPMATQGSGQEFDPLSSQMGTNLFEDYFVNASGEFNPMDTQSGGFSPMETQFANISSTSSNMPTTSPTQQSNQGFLSGVNIGDLFNSGISIWQTKEQGKQQTELVNAQIKAKELELQALVEQGKLTSKQMQQQLDVLKLQKDAPKEIPTVVYVIGGVVILGALGTAIYFATRKR